MHPAPQLSFLYGGAFIHFPACRINRHNIIITYPQKKEKGFSDFFFRFPEIGKMHKAPLLPERGSQSVKKV